MSTSHRLYILTILAKGALGLIQLATAMLLYVGALQYLPRILRQLVEPELSGDPTDFLATRILSLANVIPSSPDAFFTIYFASHGALHVAVVAALLSGARWANRAAVAVLVGFVVYQVYEWLHIGGYLLIVLTLIDLGVIALTLQENRRVRAGA